jgi:hypothetical protein
MELSPGLFRYRCETVYPPRYCTQDSQCDDQKVVTTDSCDDYSCAFVQETAYVAAERTGAAATASLCLPPGCCQENSDCADGTRPRKSCVKGPTARVSDTGTCQ